MSIRGLNNHSGPSDVTAVLLRNFFDAPASAVELPPVVPGVEKKGPYPDPRHLVGFSDSTPSQSEKTPFDFAVALNGKDHKPALQLELEDLEYSHMGRLRMALSSWDTALCEDCARGGSVLHSTSSSRLKLAPHRCQRRDSCPACGRAYSRTRGASAVALMDALLEPGRLLQTEPLTKAWHLVFTNPRIISQYFDELVEDGLKTDVSKLIANMTEAAQDAVARVFGPGTAAIVNVHWWNSSNPLSGRHHIHLHVTVPNVRVEYRNNDLTPTGVLFERGKLEELDIETLKTAYRDYMLKRRWVKSLGLDKDNWGLNVNVSFTQKRAGSDGYKHRVSYDARTAISDLITTTESQFLQEKRKEVRCMFAGVEYEPPKSISKVDGIIKLYLNKRSTQWFLRSCSFWQGIQTVRYTGWLTNVQRKKIGLIIVEDEQEETWDKIGFYDLISVERDFVVIGRTMLSKVGDWSGYEYSESRWHRDHVDIVPVPDAGKKFGWDDEIRPLPAKRGWGTKGD